MSVQRTAADGVTKIRHSRPGIGFYVTPEAAGARHSALSKAPVDRLAQHVTLAVAANT